MRLPLTCGRPQPAATAASGRGRFVRLRPTAARHCASLATAHGMSCATANLDRPCERSPPALLRSASSRVIAWRCSLDTRPEWTLVDCASCARERWGVPIYQRPIRRRSAVTSGSTRERGWSSAKTHASSPRSTRSGRSARDSNTSSSSPGRRDVPCRSTTCDSGRARPDLQTLEPQEGHHHHLEPQERHSRRTSRRRCASARGSRRPSSTATPGPI
jgi:hypothetical protein